MKENKKLAWFFILFVVLPFIVPFVNSSFAKPLSWNHDHQNQVSLVFFTTSILGSILVLILNSKWSKAMIWYLLPILVLIFASSILYAGSAVRNFGF